MNQTTSTWEILFARQRPQQRRLLPDYRLSCSTTWIALNFRLHCQSGVEERLAGVMTQVEAHVLSDEISVPSSICQCIIKVVRPLYGTGCIVNSDNYYTSVQLLDVVHLKGLYGRGTVKKFSAHFPKHVVLENKDCTRGMSRQGVSADRNTVAASWYDSSIVNVICNADAFTQTTVTRQVRSEKRTFSAPTCIKEYNTNMQGVDRLDQVRGRFSFADGHYSKKWCKKLGLALVDVARSNAYFTRKLALGFTSDRDSHQEFIVQLCSELLSEKWKESPREWRMFTPTYTLWKNRQCLKRCRRQVQRKSLVNATPTGPLTVLCGFIKTAIS
ncbi:unnamed protein product [Phytophthora fragariaefolia]|uniref:Unnamed protein product n=1 Tax=Phytophthora fragariaefolia TaxID=1490495 RepID=A0A9W6YBI6_9STRA|nr:unnamed protein product [Phytophthora fragariaefolia]